MAQVNGTSVRMVIVIGLIVGAVFGFLGGVLGGAEHTAGRIVYALSSAGLVAGALAAALRALPEDALVAAGLIGFAIAEAVAGGASTEADFASGSVFYVPALLLVAAGGLLPLWSRLAGAISAVIWAVFAVMNFSGHALASNSGLATGGYIFLTIAVIGWIWRFGRAEAEPAGVSGWRTSGTAGGLTAGRRPGLVPAARISTQYREAPRSGRWRRCRNRMGEETTIWLQRAYERNA